MSSPVIVSLPHCHGITFPIVSPTSWEGAASSLTAAYSNELPSNELPTPGRHPPLLPRHPPALPLHPPLLPRHPPVLPRHPPVLPRHEPVCSASNPRQLVHVADSEPVLVWCRSSSGPAVACPACGASDTDSHMPHTPASDIRHGPPWRHKRHVRASDTGGACVA